MKYPLTLRGTLAIIAATYLLIGPAKTHADLVSALIGSTTILVILGAAVTALVLWLKIRHSLGPQIASSGDSVKALRLERIVTTLLPIKLPPLFEVRASLQWAQDGIIVTTHRIDGRDTKSRQLIEDISFPHRGHWKLLGVSCVLRDIFGLTSLSWLEPVGDLSIRVEPSVDVHPKYIPVVSSSERAGDAVEQQLARTGDPYDLKSYHPADGSRRILWKLFAKSGALFSRLEEFSMTPEGRVVIFVLAGKEDDVLCQWALSYIKGLEELKLDVFVGCAGMSHSTSSPARSFDSTLELLIDSAWDTYWQKDSYRQKSESDSTTALSLDISKLISGSTYTGQRLSRILIFVNGETIGSASQVSALSRLGQQLQDQGIKPIFCVQERISSKSTSSSISNTLSRFIVASAETGDRVEDPNSYPRFLKVCAEAQWHVIV